MDNLPAQATFVEIAFAINLLFAAYDKVRDYLGWILTTRLKKYLAFIQTLEPATPSPTDSGHTTALKNKVHACAEVCKDCQETFVSFARFASCVAAAACVVVVYFNLLTDLGHETGWLLSPLLSYCAATLVNWLVFRWRCFRRVRRFRNFYKDFPATTVPKPPPELQASS